MVFGARHSVDRTLRPINRFCCTMRNVAKFFLLSFICCIENMDNLICNCSAVPVCIHSLRVFQSLRAAVGSIHSEFYRKAPWSMPHSIYWDESNDMNMLRLIDFILSSDCLFRCSHPIRFNQRSDLNLNLPTEMRICVHSSHHSHDPPKLCKIASKSMDQHRSTDAANNKKNFTPPKCSLKLYFRLITVHTLSNICRN